MEGLTAVLVYRLGLLKQPICIRAAAGDRPGVGLKFLWRALDTHTPQGKGANEDSESAPNVLRVI